MTKRMIDADALFEWIEGEAKTMQVTEMLFRGYCRTVPYIAEIALKNKVEELAENAEPDPWCYDLTEISQHKEVMIQHAFEGKKEFMHWFTADLNHPQCPEIIAWMPIPEPKGATNATDI